MTPKSIRLFRTARSAIPCGRFFTGQIFGPFGHKFYTIDSRGSVRRCKADGAFIKRIRLSKKARRLQKLSSPRARNSQED